ncbi:EAL domain-containing protein [Aurantiacibacter gilvus]|uniref:EAL domain-containing protein n=1 Tax=Aurantiacibacter gilvus TaxID=3139141 RepID=A0ABU9ICF2_9SPHN
MSVPAPVHERRQRIDRRRSEPHPITEDLVEALADDAITLLFQPQFHSGSDVLAGGEALVRWVHPVHGPMAGDALVAIAQSGGVSRRLSRHIARSALAEAASWPDHLRLSLNVTAMDLFDRSFGEDLLAMVEASDFPPERLTLEITEQALVADLDRSAKALRELADRGMSIALDDFGAGFCNFRYLKVLPLDALKLDRSMIEGIASDERDLAVLRGILAMARALDLKVIAEGIENAEVRDIAVREGCHLWQGFLGGKPMAVDRFALLAAT